MTEQQEKRPDVFVVEQGEDDQWYWTRTAPNGEPVSDGGEGHPDMNYTINAAIREGRHQHVRVVVKGALEDGKDMEIEVNPPEDSE